MFRCGFAWIIGTNVFGRMVRAAMSEDCSATARLTTAYTLIFNDLTSISRKGRFWSRKGKVLKQKRAGFRRQNSTFYSGNLVRFISERKAYMPVNDVAQVPICFLHTWYQTPLCFLSDYFHTFASSNPTHQKKPSEFCRLIVQVACRLMAGTNCHDMASAATDVDNQMEPNRFVSGAWTHSVSIESMTV